MNDIDRHVGYKSDTNNILSIETTTTKIKSRNGRVQFIYKSFGGRKEALENYRKREKDSRKGIK